MSQVFVERLRDCGVSSWNFFNKENIVRINVNITIDIDHAKPSGHCRGVEKFESWDEMLESMKHFDATRHAVQGGLSSAKQVVEDSDALKSAMSTSSQNPFAAGDVVRLKTGGVRRVITSIDGDVCTCCWDSPYGKAMKGIYHVNALEHVPDEDESKEEE